MVIGGVYIATTKFYHTKPNVANVIIPKMEVLQKGQNGWICSQCHEFVVGAKKTCVKCNVAKPAGVRKLRKPHRWRPQIENGGKKQKLECANESKLSFTIRQDLECVVCLAQERNSCLPCGHVSMCVNCVESLDKCPICRASYQVHEIKNVFLCIGTSS
jgi:hypothetical protein